jgi:hypothetical protein
VEETYPNREDLVEAALAEVQVFEGCDQELGLAGLHVGGIAALSGLDHLRRAVHRRETAASETLADQRGRNPVSAADLEHAVVGPYVKALDDGSQALAQAARAIVAIAG